MNTAIRYCDNCGATNRSDAKFCYACGQPQLNYTNTATGLLTNFHELKQRYRIIEKLGQGGFGAIYKAEDTLFHNAIRAVKEMGMRGMNEQETKRAILAFKNEALLLADLSHPNLPRIYDHFEDHGRWYLVMDYIRGETLEARLDEQPTGTLSIEETLLIAIQICSVLDYLHGHQPPIIFRDLKPGNVMLTPDERLYLIDFGIARFFKPGQSTDTTILGTPGYAAPEQYGRMQTTARSDIYSLGATLYHLISGIYPGLHPFLFQPLDLDPQIPGNAELEALIMQMLELKEDKRPPNILSIQQELEKILHLRQTPIPSPPPVPQAPIAAPESVPLPIIDIPVVNAPAQIINSSTRLLFDTPRPSVVVAQDGSGDYTTISEALKQAEETAFILLRPGVYNESLLLNKDVEIIGNGPKEQIILESRDQHTLVMQGKHAVLRGLTIRCLTSGTTQRYVALAILQGELFVEDCAITSASSAAIAISNEQTRPTLRYCTISASASSGIILSNNAQAVIEHCEISQNSESGISITSGANPTLRHCTIRHNRMHGVFVSDGGRGTFEDCAIYQNTYSGIAVVQQSNPLLLRCQVHANLRYGVVVQQEGRGSFQDSAIHTNSYDNVLITTESTPYFYLCQIYAAGQSGIAVINGGKGSIEYCEIRGSRNANISIASGGDPLVRSCKIFDGLEQGVYVQADGRGTVERCTIRGNAGEALQVEAQSAVVLKGNSF